MSSLQERLQRIYSSNISTPTQKQVRDYITANAGNEFTDASIDAHITPHLEDEKRFGEEEWNKTKFRRGRKG